MGATERDEQRTYRKTQTHEETARYSTWNSMNLDLNIMLMKLSLINVEFIWLNFKSCFLDSEKRKRVRVDTHLAEAAAIAHTHEPDGSASKIPKIKIVFQQKGPGVAPSAEPVGKLQSHSSDSNSEAKTAIKNKIKRNKLDPIVISLPSTAMFHNKDPLSHQQTVKRPRPANLGLNLAQTNLMAASRASGLMLSPSLLAQSPLLASQLSNSSHTFSPSIDINQLLAQRSADHTPVDIFSESETSCAASPADGLGEDTRTIKAHAALAIDETTARAIKPHPALAIDDTAARTIKTHPSLTMDESEHYTMPFKRCPDVGQGFRISPSALRSIKQKIDSINANQSSWKAASKNIKSPSLTVPNSSEHGKKSDAS